MSIKKYILKYIFVYICLCLAFFANAQDTHYSQWYNSSLNLNSATAGLIETGDYRFSGNFKNQWQSIPVPYNTSTLAVDAKLKKQYLKQDAAGVGILMNYDKSGNAQFKTLQVLLNGAYHKCVSSDSTSFISIGIQPGFANKALDYNKLSYDNQYNGDNYDPSSSNGESLPASQLNYFELGTGLNFYKKLNNRNSFNLGFSAQHLTNPRQSFFKNTGVRLDKKFINYASITLKAAARLDLTGALMYARQGKYQELIPGLTGKYLLNPVNGKPAALYLRTLFRGKDAMVFTTGFDYFDFHFEMSYDTNISGLIPASNYRGGFEISLIYIIRKNIPFVAKKRVCPDSM